jgi:hypothetical protein
MPRLRTCLIFEHLTNAAFVSPRESQLKIPPRHPYPTAGVYHVLIFDIKRPA